MTLTINTTGGTAVSAKETIQPGAFAIGVNLDGMEYNGGPNAVANTTYAVPSLSELQYYKSQGQNLIRLPIAWESLQTSLGGALNANYLASIQSVVNNAASLGMKVILDMHDYGGYNGNKIGSSAVSAANFANVWQQLAKIFAGNAGIGGYDLMNEPNAMPNTNAWPTAAQAAINAIRTSDSSTTIYVEGDGWSSAGSWAETNNGLASLKDSSNNLVFSAHLYLDRDNSGTHFDWAQEAANGVTTQTGVTRLSDFVGWLKANNLKGDIGEIGVGNNNPAWLTSLDNTLAYAKANNVQVTYWAGGPWWGAYPMSVEPTNGVSAPQMAVLDKYSGAVPTVSAATVSGIADANATVYLSENETVVGTTQANASGAWSATLTGLSNGVHVIVTGENQPTVDGTIAATVFNLQSSGGTTPSPTGSSTGTLVLGLSEDAYQGDAQFTVSVDGKQVGSAQSVTTLHSSGQSQSFTFNGNFGPGSHQVAVNFLNDAWGGTASTDRNLYVNTITMNGTTSTVNAAQLSAGTVNYMAGADTLTLGLSEDAYQGDAQFAVYVDGKQVGGTQSVTASHSAGQTQFFTLTGQFGQGAHTVSVGFLNDAWGGSASTDRNLYVDTVTLDSSRIAENAEQARSGWMNYATSTPAMVTGTSGNDTLQGTTATNVLIGNGGTDNYAMGSGDANDTIVNGSSGSAAAAGSLTTAAASGQLWFQKTGNDLVVDVMGTNKQTVINNWYGSSGAQLSQIAGSDGLKIDSGLQTLVQAMATFTAAHAGFNPQTAAQTNLSGNLYNGALATAAGTAWHK